MSLHTEQLKIRTSVIWVQVEKYICFCRKYTSTHFGKKYKSEVRLPIIGCDFLPMEFVAISGRR